MHTNVQQGCHCKNCLKGDSLAVPDRFKSYVGTVCSKCSGDLTMFLCSCILIFAMFLKLFVFWKTLEELYLQFLKTFGRFFIKYLRFPFYSRIITQELRGCW